MVNEWNIATDSLKYERGLIKFDIIHLGGYVNSPNYQTWSQSCGFRVTRPTGFILSS